jgi:hypothetical protein
MVHESEVPFSGKCKAKRVEVKENDAWHESRSAYGLPPWISKGQADRADDSTTLKSSKTLRQWADEYCASPKYLKDFKYRKVLYGWNIQQMEVAIRSMISSTPYHGQIHVSFKIESSKVHVRPNNRLSRMMDNMWWKFLSIILLIFPFIWLFKRFNSRGGGRWEVCGGAYSLKREVYEQSPSIRKWVIGVSEAEWLRRCEAVIKRSVHGHYISSTPIVVPNQPEPDHGSQVGYQDGYQPHYTDAVH